MSCERRKKSSYLLDVLPLASLMLHTFGKEYAIKKRDSTCSQAFWGGRYAWDT